MLLGSFRWRGRYGRVISAPPPPVHTATESAPVKAAPGPLGPIGITSIASSISSSSLRKLKGRACLVNEFDEASDDDGGEGDLRVNRPASEGSGTSSNIS
jgi:hypothetical protein